MTFYLYKKSNGEGRWTMQRGGSVGEVHLGTVTVNADSQMIFSKA